MLTGKSFLDQLFRTLIRSNFFTCGFGEVQKIERLLDFHKKMSNRIVCQQLIPDDYPVAITKLAEEDNMIVVSGNLESPFAKHMPGFLPPESETSTFQLCIPKEWKTQDRPVAIHLAGTGDHHFWRRRKFMASALIADYGIASLLLENPFYGSRKPAKQWRSNLRYVSDIFVMGGGLILESMAILRWLEGLEFGPFCLTGISMGGHMASLAATNWHKPIPLVPCLSWTSASGVFTRGVMSRAVDWKNIEKEYVNTPALREELLNHMTNFKLDYLEDSIAAAARDASVKRTSRIKSILSKSAAKVMGSLGLSRLFTNRSDFFPVEPSSSSSVEFNPGKTSSFPITRFFSFEKIQSSGRSDNFVREFDLKGNNEKRLEELETAVFWNVFNRFETQTRRDTREFMRRIMDHFTHIGNFSVPVDPELIIAVVARDDAYVLREGVAPMNEIWGGCEIRCVRDGHVYACLMERKHFRTAINDAINRYREKYNLDGTPRKTSLQT
jgi:hypothetical protein